MKTTAFEVASDNSLFLLSLVDVINELPLNDRVFIRRKILEQNEKNLALMKEDLKPKSHEKSINH